MAKGMGGQDIIDGWSTWYSRVLSWEIQNTAWLLSVGSCLCLLSRVRVWALTP